MTQFDLWYSMAKVVCRGYMALFIESIQVQGHRNIPSGPKIIIANHPNATDAFVLPFLFREKLHFLVEEDLFKLPVFGKMLLWADMIPVQVGRGREALKNAQEKLMSGKTVVIFPEGHLNHGDALRRAGSGAAVLAVNTGLPVLPIGFYVPDESTKTFIRHRWDRTTVGRWQWGGSTYVSIGEPLFPGSICNLEDQRENLRAVTEHMMARVAMLISQAREMTADGRRMTANE